MARSRRIWWIHAATWDMAGLPDARHTYVELCSGRTHVRIAQRLDATTARYLERGDLTARWQPGDVTIRFASETAARAAAKAAFAQVRGRGDVLFEREPDEPCAPLIAPPSVMKDVDRLLNARLSADERRFAWRWLILNAGWEMSGVVDGAPAEIVMEPDRGQWRVAEVAEPRSRTGPTPTYAYTYAASRRSRPRDGD